MNLKTTLILILLLVLVGGYIAFDRSRGDAPPPMPVVAEKIVPEATKSVGVVEIRWRDYEIKLLRTGVNWELKRPFDARADREAVRQVLDALVAAESKGVPDDGAKAGFTAAVTVDVGEKTVAVSTPNALGDAVVRVGDPEGQHWYLTSGTLTAALTKTPASFRDTHLVTTSIGEITSITLKQPKAAVTVTKAGDGWQVSDGITTAKGDEAAVGDLLQVLTGLKAAEIPATEPVMAFDATPLVVTLKRASSAAATTSPSTTAPGSPAGQEEVIRFGRFEDALRERVIVGAGGVVAYVPGFALNSLSKSVLDLREKQVLNLATDEIQQIDIQNEAIATTRPETAVSLRLAPGQIVPPATSPSAPRWMVGNDRADGEKVATLVETLRSLTATRFLSGDAATKPSTSWMVRIKTAKGEHELQVGEKALRLDGLTFEPATPLLPLISTPFVRPAAVETRLPTTEPATAPAGSAAPATQP